MMLTAAQAAALYDDRGGVEVKSLLHMIVKDANTNDTVHLGFWSGDYDANWTVDGTTRTFVALESSLDFGDVVYRAGLEVGSHTVTLNGADTGVRAFVRNYNYRFAESRLYLGYFHPQSGVNLGFRRIWEGPLNDAPEEHGQLNGTIGLSLTIADKMRYLSQSTNMTKGHASQELINGDQLYSYSTQTNQTDDKWAQE